MSRRRLASALALSWAIGAFSATFGLIRYGEVVGRATIGLGARIAAAGHPQDVQELTPVAWAPSAGAVTRERARLASAAR